MIDPVCAFHGKKRSEHECLYCVLCFETLTLEQCHVRPDGLRENVCKTCAELERRQGMARAAAWDAGNRSMREAGRIKWNEEDYNAACGELERLLGPQAVGED